MKNFEFNGSGWEYFKIWIVNILLTIITLGIYYPWAKVRNNRYLYANSIIEDKNFNYHARGIQLLLGYIVAVALVILYKITESASPQVALGLILVFFLAIPWLIYRSMRFNLSVTSFNNVRFKFTGSVKKSYLIFLGIPLLMIVSFGLTFAIFKSLTPSIPIVILGVIAFTIIVIVSNTYFYTIKSRYYIGHSNYGNSSFKTNLETSEFLKIILKTVLISIGIFLAFILVVGGIAYLTINMESFLGIINLFNSNPDYAMVILLQTYAVIFFAFYLILIAMNIITFAYFQTRQRKYVYENTTLNENINFKSTMKVIPYAMLLLTNFILVLFTLGLAFPWAKVRVARYTLENTAVEYDGDFHGFFGDIQKESAFGEEIGDTLNLDIGIPL